jgi:hypothetical protein
MSVTQTCQHHKFNLLKSKRKWFLLRRRKVGVDNPFFHRYDVSGASQQGSSATTGDKAV